MNYHPPGEPHRGRAAVLIPASAGNTQAHLVRFAGLLLEKGIPLYRTGTLDLPASFPHDIRGVKAVVLRKKTTRKFSRQVEAFRKRGVYILPLDLPDRGWLPEDALRNSVETLELNASLAPDYEDILASGDRASDNRLIRRLAGVLRKEVVFYRAWNDATAYQYWRPTEETVRYLGDRSLDKVFEKTIVLFMKETPNRIENTDNLAPLRYVLHRYEKTGDPVYLSYAKDRVDRAIAEFPRISGAMVHQPGRDAWLWVEVLAMFCPTAACLARITGDRRYLDEALRQIRVTEKLCAAPSGLWYHAGMPGRHTPVFWGRGLGWVLLGITGVLDELKPTDSNRPYLTGLLEKILAGIMPVQDKCGFWRNVLDDSRSRPEASCTCIFTQVYARALRNGWLRSEDAERMLLNAWRAIKAFFFCDDRLLSVCRGTSASLDPQFYLSRPYTDTTSGPVLLAGIEMMRLRNVRP
ncbi:MAG: glycoside hydrolase family 88 protein [Candidatus Omnitrophota bacterium]